MKKKIYKVEHPTIKEISIGDKFVTREGKIVIFVKYDAEHTFGGDVYPYEMKENKNIDGISIERMTFNSELKFLNIISNKDIKERYIPLKDKLDLL